MISISMDDGSNFTFYQCTIKEAYSEKYKIFFQTSLRGDYIEKINDILCMSVEFIINAEPIPLVPISFLPEYSDIESANMIVKCKKNIYGVSLVLETINGALPIEVFETVFFNILDISYLGNGYYPYIISEYIFFNNKEHELSHIHQSIYKKGKSGSHWNKTIIAGRDLILNNIYPVYLKNIEKNELIIPVLRNVSHSQDIYSNLILSCLIQCVEGYIKKSHLESKYSKKIVKSITCKECLRRAVDYNEYTREVFCEEIESNQLDDFINKSKKTRNQFSHMVPLKDTITGGIELYQAINKYSLLLRILILSDLNVKIYKSNIERNICNVNSSTCQ